ncbi:MAG: Gfo/Idh/MocA family oxidoreductase [Phycisphaerae bacterium]|nr:Gfo/Idh/MocA family oxidoreductase [Phycisphaerae bacterium]
MAKKRFAQVGLGGRSWMYTSAVMDRYPDVCEMVGFCDINPGRLKMRVSWAADTGREVPGYEAKDFERMVAEQKPDCVIVTSGPDVTHSDYIRRAMELGCDVITEKPMTTDEIRCRKIIETQKATGRKCTVTFNYRYSPPRTQIKDMLMSGVIGDVQSVDFHWLLNTHHGADYFRRWHRNKRNSGGLMVHKATHHFDLVNWWLSAVPTKVFAMGHRKFYTPATAERAGLTKRSERCLDCPEAGKCSFHVDMRSNESLRDLYLENEHHDGYIRDRCVFSDQIDIEDSMNVVVEYDTGAKLSYSLNAFTPWEGYMIAFNGSKGRLEHVCQESVYINGDGTVPGELINEGTHTRVFPHFQTSYSVDLWTGTGGHGGGDDPLLADLFAVDPPKDKYLRAADERSGAYSILTGVAANHSMASGQAVRIAELVPGLRRPDYPPMPTDEDPIEMVKPNVKLVGAHEAGELKKQQVAAKQGG